MKFTMYLTIVVLSTLSVIQLSSGAEVTNDQLRDGLLSLVHSYSLLENKLDRHEQRERALGDVIKRGLQTLQKGQKIFEPMRGTFARLDERISEIETELIAQDKKNSDQQDKIAKALETIMRWMADNTVQSKSSKNDGSDEDEENLSKKVETLGANIKELRKEISEMMAKTNTAEETSKGLLEQTEKLVNSKLASADEVISKIEDKLTQFYVTSPISTPAPIIRNTEWEDNILGLLQDIKSTTSELNKTAPVSFNELLGLEKEFFVTIANETLEAIEDMRMEVLTASDKSFTKTASRIKEAADNLDTSLNEVLKSVSETETMFETVLQSNKEMKNDMSALGKLENIVLETGDNVLSIKRGMEYNVHAITLEVGDLVKSKAREMNSTFHKQFDALNATILSNHNGALSNLTSKIETEISQVWRQIGIMYQEVSSSKQALNKLQEQTEAYVNGTFTTMDSMEGKVSQITGRMAEVDSNLNYLLGRLSLVTQEFNQIKTGLGSALDNIRSSFQIVQNKIKDVGPGPHQIPDEENETDFNLLPQHDAPGAT